MESLRYSLLTHYRANSFSELQKIIYKFVKWVPCHHSMAHLQVAHGDGLQIWMVAANILNVKSEIADKW
jgi:hypothetical protein